MPKHRDDSRVEVVARTLNVELEGAGYEDAGWKNFSTTAQAVVRALDGINLPVPVTGRRTSSDLRDILFEELASLRREGGNPSRANAVASLARQIVNTAQAELKMLREIDRAAEAGKDIDLGGLALGTSGESS